MSLEEEKEEKFCTQALEVAEIYKWPYIGGRISSPFYPRVTEIFPQNSLGLPQILLQKRSMFCTLIPILFKIS